MEDVCSDGQMRGRIQRCTVSPLADLMKNFLQLVPLLYDGGVNGGLDTAILPRDSMFACLLSRMTNYGTMI